ncbi:MAG: glycosyl transferase family 1 [Saprospiraceae bacterium]|nr:MAG: glycosyl transferase family 1 [Saprospiraceae bacterium]
MRIAVNTRFLLKGHLEGIGWFTDQVLRRLVEWHPEHEFIFLFDRPFDEAFIYGKNVTPVVCFPPARHALLWYWWFEYSLPAALKRYEADVLLSPDGFCSLRTKTPTVMVTHDIAHIHFPKEVPLHGRVFYRYFVPRYLQRAEEVITVSAFTKKDILDHYPVEGEKIMVACNGCREDFHPLTESEKGNVRERYAHGEAFFFYLGAVHPRKNVHRLIAAFDRFKQRTKAPAKLLIGGRFGWQTGAVKSAYEAAEHREDIVFLGYVPDEDLPRLTGAALALVYASLFEGFGVPLLEAMYCDTPVITSNISSMPEVVGPAGYLVDPLIVDQIAIAMQDLWQKPALRQEMVRAGRIQRERFSWDRAAATVWAGLERIGKKA